MANEEHVAILRQGGEVWSKWRRENPSVLADPIEAGLSKANLSPAILVEANLSGAELSWANLWGLSRFGA